MAAKAMPEDTNGTSGSHPAGSTAGAPVPAGEAGEAGDPVSSPSLPPAPPNATRARELAHALANALMPVTGYADLLTLHPAVRREAALAGRVAEMVRAAERCASILAELHRELRAPDPGPGS
jgi:hypothetical protein